MWGLGCWGACPMELGVYRALKSRLQVSGRGTMAVGMVPAEVSPSFCATAADVELGHIGNPLHPQDLLQEGRPMSLLKSMEGTAREHELN